MLEEFLIKCQSDEKLGAGLRKAMEDENAKDKVQALIAYGKECGYEFNVDDIKEYSKKISADEAELSDDELGAVAGGSKAGARDFVDGFKLGFVSMATSLGLCLADY